MKKPGVHRKGAGLFFGGEWKIHIITLGWKRKNNETKKGGMLCNRMYLCFPGMFGER